MSQIQKIVVRIAEIGKDHPSLPPLHAVEPFDHFFEQDGSLDRKNLDKRDGSCTRREVILRFLLLNAVIDQGPDIVGVRQLLVDVTNDLYRQEVRFLHRPLSFFEELGLAIDRIIDRHDFMKKLRAEIWAQENQSNASRYNLFMDNSTQALNYAVFRWGVPLALPLVLDRRADDQHKHIALLDYLQSFESAERMSQQVKDDSVYGLGKAIGDKACHLFAKWMVSTFGLTQRSGPSWGPFSFEVPYDSNAGRVLWRTGYLLQWASESAYQTREVVQPGEGKGGVNYIRVTNIRGMPTTDLPSHLKALYDEIAVQCLKTHARSPRKVEIQRVQHVYLFEVYPANNLSVADFDDGLIYIGTRYCFNHDQPRCPECPIQDLCGGYQERPELIREYRT